MEILDLIDTEVGKDKVARKHIRRLEEMVNTLLQDPPAGDFMTASPAMTEGLGEMKRFTVASSVKKSTAAVMPPSDIPPTGTVKEKNPRSEENVLVRDASEQGWASISRDFVPEFCENLGVTPVWPTEK